MRQLIATSHKGAFSYWREENTVFSRHGMSDEWIGYMCHIDVWNRTYSKLASKVCTSAEAAAFLSQRLKMRGWDGVQVVDAVRGLAWSWESLFIVVGFAPNEAAFEEEPGMDRHFDPLHTVQSDNKAMAA